MGSNGGSRPEPPSTVRSVVFGGVLREMPGTDWRGAKPRPRRIPMKTRHRFVTAGLAALSLSATLAAGMAAKSTIPTAAPSDEPTLAEVRQLTERFRDVTVALAEGYIRDPFNLCDTAEMMGRPASLGAMGIHYFRPDLLGITAPPSPRVNGAGTHTDFRKPSILIYEPQADGSLQLVAVENLVFAAPWRAAGHTEPPSFH